MEEKKIWEREREQSNIWCCCKEQRWFTSYKQNILFRSHNNFYKAMPVNKTSEMILKDLNSKNKMQQKAKKRIFCVCFKDECFGFHKNFQIYFNNIKWCHGVVVITTPQLHSSMAELRFQSQNVAHLTREDLWQWYPLEIRLNTFRRSTIPQKQIMVVRFGCKLRLLFI